MTATQHWFFHSAMAQLVIDPVDDKVLAVNKELCRLLQTDKATVLDLPVSQLFSPSLPDMLVFTQALIEQGRGWCGHLIVQAQHDIHVEVSGRCDVTTRDQKPAYCIYLTLQPAEILTQLREQAQAQHHFSSGLGHWNRVATVFQEFERENQLLLDAAGEGIYGVDAQGMTTFVNPAAQRILGYSAEELAGRNMHSMVHYSHGDGSHFDVHDCPIFAAFRDGNVQRVDDDVFWNKAGEPVDVEYTSTPIRDNGTIVGAVVVFRDVSQKKADRKRLLEALEEVEALKNRLQMENAYLIEALNSEFNQHRILGSSSAIQTTLQQIRLVAPTQATVLITGESGTGKELIARAIHEASSRSQRSLIRVNCAAIPADLFESEFFGHAKGAFTGATADRPGRFELADGGTLFLDEVGELPLYLQGKLLRVLQEQQFERVGESKTRHVDVRIITATNKDLKQAVQLGSFREDLFFRLNVFPIESVALRYRREDIPELTEHFLVKAGLKLGKAGLKVSARELEKLKAYHWPGNIRELENVIERQAILARGEQVIFPQLCNDDNESIDQRIINQAGPAFITDETILQTESERRDSERRNIINALMHSRGKVSGAQGAARMLGVNPSTLASRIKKLGIKPRRYKEPDSISL